jgi:two-component system, OmpR family, sensor kinase
MNRCRKALSAVAHDMRNYLTPKRGRTAILFRRALREHRQADVRRRGGGSGPSNDCISWSSMCWKALDSTRDYLPSVARKWTWSTWLKARRRRPWIHVETPTRTLAALVDPERIRQTLDNLVANAVSHSPDHGVVLIQVARDDRSDTTSLKLTVEDQGPGISIELLPSLFAPFETGPGSGGLGLGLYLARQCAVAHGGSLNIEPTPGHGARFVLTLPDCD